MKIPDRGWLRRALLVSVAVAPLATPAAVECQQSSDTTIAASSASHAALFTRRDAVTTAAFLLGTAAIMPLDRHIAVESQRPSLQNNSALSHGLTGIRVLGEPGSIVLAGATYLYGRSESSPRSAELGLRTLEGIGAAGITAYVIKGFAGRARPFVVSDTNPHDYKFGRGFGKDNYTSFPSGHTTVAFAAASAASDEIGYLWPHASHLWTPALFTAASLVAVARVYEDKHWASDVVAGAAVGTIVSRMAVRYARAHPHNLVDRVLMPVGVSQVNGSRAVTLNWNYQW